MSFVTSCYSDIELRKISEITNVLSYFLIPNSGLNDRVGADNA